MQQVERWTWVPPKEEDTGEIPLGIEVRDENDKVVARGQTTVRVSGAGNGSGRPLRLLCIGDSLTHASVYTGELLNLCAGPDQPKLKLLGTHHPYPEIVDSNVHEGYGGWRYADFVEKFAEHPVPGSYQERSSPFVYPSAQGPVLDVAHYIKENCEGKPPDAVTILLGANDVWGMNDATRDKGIQLIMGYAEKLIGAIHSAAPRTRIGILPLLPPAGQDAFGAAKYWDYRKSQHRLVEELLRKYQGQEADGLFIIPAYVMIDTVHGYPQSGLEPVNSRSPEEISRQNNAVHLNSVGYNQTADAIFYWLKSAFSI
jgi:lysophospholipase L1-like esterase